MSIPAGGTFIDTARITVEAGRGGDGCSSFYRDKYTRPYPDGGRGGAGGDVLLRVNPNLATLLDFQYRRQFAAGRGGHGGPNGRTGARGADCVIPVPSGTVVYDGATGEPVGDLTRAGQDVIVARGGAAGIGNQSKRDAEPGAAGEARELALELKLLADVGIVGAPNAGKSTLLSRISSARPKIAEYPFTTLHPVLGMVRLPGGRGEFVACDVPGLIDGAHDGRGLGLQFLRHTERTRVLIHLIDMAGVDGRDPLEDLRMVAEELRHYNAVLAKRPRLVAANKMDLPQAAVNLARVRKRFKGRLYAVSCATGEGLPALLDAVWRRVQRARPTASTATKPRA